MISNVWSKPRNRLWGNSFRAFADPQITRFSQIPYEFPMFPNKNLVHLVGKEHDT